MKLFKKMAKKVYYNNDTQHFEHISYSENNDGP